MKNVGFALFFLLGTEKRFCENRLSVFGRKKFFGGRFLEKREKEKTFLCNLHTVYSGFVF